MAAIMTPRFLPRPTARNDGVDGKDNIQQNDLHDDGRKRG